MANEFKDVYSEERVLHARNPLDFLLPSYYANYTLV